MVVTMACAFGQVAPPNVAFEVTSVKPTQADTRKASPPPACSAGGTYTAAGQGVAASIRFAYNVRPFQLAGMPDWSRGSDAVYDVAGKAAGPVDESQCRQMVQALLAERLKLAVHREMRPFIVYALTVAKNGPKLRKAGDSKGNPVRINGAPGFGDGKGWSMAQLADFLSRGFPGSVVIDRTGLEGLYGIVFDFEVPRGLAPGAEMAAAVQRELGLKLEERKEPFEFVVVDRIDRPTEN